MNLKKSKKSRALLHLNRVKIFSDFEFLQLRGINRFCGRTSFSDNGFYSLTDLNQNPRQIRGLRLNFFFVSPPNITRRVIAVGPSSKNLCVTSHLQLDSYRLLKWSLKTKPFLVRGRFSGIRKFRSSVSFRGAKYLAFFEYARDLFNWKDYAYSSTFTSFNLFDSSWNRSPGVIAKYAKIAGTFILYPYWVGSSLSIKFWSLYFGIPAVTSIINTSMSAVGSNSNLQPRYDSYAFCYNKVQESTDSAVQNSGRLALMNFYLLVCVFLVILQSRRGDLLKQFEISISGTERRRVSEPIILGGLAVLIPKTFKVKQSMRFLISRLFVPENSSFFWWEAAGKFFFVKQLRQISFVQSWVTLDLFALLRNWRATRLQQMDVTFKNAGVRLTVLSQSKKLFVYNNLFRPKFLFFLMLFDTFDAFSRAGFLWPLISQRANYVFFSIKEKFFRFFSKNFKKLEFNLGFSFLSAFRLGCYTKTRIFWTFGNSIFLVRTMSTWTALFVFVIIAVGALWAFLASFTVIKLVHLAALVLIVFMTFFAVNRIRSIATRSVWSSLTSQNSVFFNFGARYIKLYVKFFSQIFLFDLLWLCSFCSRIVVAKIVKISLIINADRLTRLTNTARQQRVRLLASRRKFSLRFSTNFVVRLVRILTHRDDFKLALIGFWRICSIVSPRECSWFIIGIVVVLWAQLFWWFNPSADVGKWRQIFAVNRIVSVSAGVQRNSAVNGSFFWLASLDYLTAFLSLRHFRIQNIKNLGVLSRVSSVYYKFLIAVKVNLLGLNWASSFGRRDIYNFGLSAYRAIPYSAFNSFFSGSLAIVTAIVTLFLKILRGGWISIVCFAAFCSLLLIFINLLIVATTLLYYFTANWALLCLSYFFIKAFFILFILSKSNY